MICSNCGQYLNDGVKFCTKCGAKSNAGLTNKDNKLFTYLSLTFSVVGIICTVIFQQIYLKEFTHNIWMMLCIFRILTLTGIILAIMALYKSKSKLAFIAGLIPCVYLVIIRLNGVFPFLGFLRYLGF